MTHSSSAPIHACSSLHRTQAPLRQSQPGLDGFLLWTLSSRIGISTKFVCRRQVCCRWWLARPTALPAPGYLPVHAGCGLLWPDQSRCPNLESRCAGTGLPGPIPREPFHFGYGGMHWSMPPGRSGKRRALPKVENCCAEAVDDSRFSALLVLRVSCTRCPTAAARPNSSRSTGRKPLIKRRASWSASCSSFRPVSKSLGGCRRVAHIIRCAESLNWHRVPVSCWARPS